MGRIESLQLSQSPLYFVHESTSGYSFPPLFRDPQAMWEVWDTREDYHDLERAVPALSTSVLVVGVSFAYGRCFDADGSTFGDPTFGLATEDRLISSSQFEDRDLSLLDVSGVVHIAEEVDGGMGFGRYDSPLCVEWYTLGKADRAIDLAEMYGKPLHLCPACVAAVTGN
jgi:hypothetical protein